MLRLVVLCLLVTGTAGVARSNQWGWWYDSGAPIAYERRVNIVAQMLINGLNTAAAAAFVKCFVGAASFELPWAFMQGGRMGSVLGLLGLAACSFFALSRLAQCAHMVPGAARPTSAGRIWQGFLEGSC